MKRVSGFGLLISRMLLYVPAISSYDIRVDPTVATSFVPYCLLAMQGAMQGRQDAVYGTGDFLLYCLTYRNTA